MVDYLQREPQKFFPILYAQYPFTMWLCSLSHQEVGNISPHLEFEVSLSVAWTNRLWWRYWLWLPSLDLPQETCQQLFFPSWSIALKLPWGEDQTLGAWKTMWPSCPVWSPPDQPAYSQSTTTRYVSEAISNHLAPVKLPVNWSQKEWPQVR